MDKFIAKNLLKYKGVWYETGTEVPVENDVATALVVDGTLEIKQTSVTNKGNAGAGNNPPAPEDPQITEYADKTNADQLAYLDTLNDADFKIQAEKLLSVSKSKSKVRIEQRLKLKDT